MATSFAPLRRSGSGAAMVCLHGFTDSWRTWELVLPAPPLPDPISDGALADAVEVAMDDSGFATAHGRA